jgi:hypothetical protein
MIKTILSGKHASILFDRASLGPSFPVTRGSGQGDPPSPPLFNLALEPLLLKIKYSRNFIPATLTTNFISIKISKIFAYADDIQSLGKLTLDNLKSIEHIFDEFAKLSGLTLNKMKTEVLIINPTQELRSMVANNFSFKLVDSIKTLGFTIDPSLTNLNCNFDQMISKMQNIIKFWSKFKLTVFGRKCVANTYLISQLSYFVSVLKPDSQTISRIERIISDYIIGNEKFARDRLFFQVNRGGLGFTKISDYIDSLQTTCVRNSLLSSHKTVSDNFISSISYKSFFSNTKKFICKYFPYSLCLVKSKDKWLDHVSHLGNNFNDISPFNLNRLNQNLSLSPAMVTTILSEQYALSNSPISCFIDNNGLILQFNDLKRKLGTNLRFNTYFHVRNHIQALMLYWSNNVQSQFIDVKRLFVNKKLKSKAFRKYFVIVNEKNNAWARRFGTNFVPNNKPFHAFEIVNSSQIPNYYKICYWKYLNNTLLFGNQISKFIREESPLCNFCGWIRLLPQQLETTYHVVNDCIGLISYREFILTLYNLLGIDTGSSIQIDRIGFLGTNQTFLCNILLNFFLKFLVRSRKLTHDPGIDLFKIKLKNYLTLISRINDRVNPLLELIV